MPAAATSAVAPVAAASEAIQHPITQAGPAVATTAALPALDASDGDVANALASLGGGSELSSLLIRSQIIARIVATVDALPRHDWGARMLPLRTPKGDFITADANGSTVIGGENAERYAPYMRLVDSADPAALVAWYVHAYPLFQQAYRELGYPNGYFNDRLIAAIDDMLSAPEPTQSPVLVRSNAHYVYADPALESLSAGQRLLLRVGPADEARIKTKLRAIRHVLTAGGGPATH